MTSTVHIKPDIGDKAPLFTLSDDEGNRFSLKEELKKHPVLLFFYPGDMTPGCTLQLCAVKDDWKRFEEAGIAIFGINHATAESHEKFRTTFRFPFPLLVDKDKKVATLYKATKPFFKTVIIKRTVIGIDQDGIIIFRKTDMPKHGDILKAFSKKGIRAA